MEISDEVVFDVTANGWRVRRGNSYDTTVLLKKASAMAHLVNRGWTQGRAKLFLDSFDLQTCVYGSDVKPNHPSLFTDPVTGDRRINLWVPPTLVPKPGPFPTIERMLGHVTHGDAEGRRWIVHKLAQKVQDPNLVSKIAMVFATTQGAGKGFLFRVMAEILGPENCAIVTQGELEGRFFGRYATKLLLLGDEVTSSENLRDISQKLKVLIDGGEIEAERKYENSVAIRSRMMWMFASNDPISSVNAEGSDRRYTFFSNFDPVTPEYTAALNACFEKDRVTLTAAFKEEIAGFAAHLLATEVDVAFVSKPYANDARKALIEANRPSHEMFFREIDDQGFDALHEYFADKDWAVRDNKAEEWDFGEKGVATSVLYQVYRAYCRASGHHSLRLNKFGGALKNRVPAYEHVRNRTKNGRQVWCYVVPRKGAQ